MPLIQDVNICQKLWLLALDQPFDAGALAALKERYDRARRQDATYRSLYREQSAAYLAELRAAQEAKRAELITLYATTTVRRRHAPPPLAGRC